MKIKDFILPVFLAVVVIGLVVFVSSSQNGKSDSSLNNSIKQTQQVQGDQSTADHHGGTQTTDSTIFNALVGKAAPDFTLESYDGKKYTLSSLKGKNVVLFFSEGLMCYPACWNQIAAFGKDQKLNNENTIVLTIVNDRKPDWKTAIDKMPELAESIVLFDTDRSVSIAYGVLNLPSSMHKGQLAGHSYVIIDKTGVVRFTSDDEMMAVRNDVLMSEIEKFQ